MGTPGHVRNRFTEENHMKKPLAIVALAAALLAGVPGAAVAAPGDATQQSMPCCKTAI